VWSDGSDGDTMLASSRAYQFLARASGGVTFWTNAASTVGAQLAPGSGTWASASDRNLKTDVARIDDAAVLDKVATLPIERWSYKSERGVRHLGPMAQDFYAAFGVGEDDKHITSIDEDGVALAAIKALHARTVSCTRNRRLPVPRSQRFTPRTRRCVTGSRPMRRTSVGSTRSLLASSPYSGSRFRRRRTLLQPRSYRRGWSRRRARDGYHDGGPHVGGPRRRSLRAQGIGKARRIERSAGFPTWRYAP
jgi:hypothetical protein